MQKYPRRRLTWQNPLGVCEVHANYPKVWCIYAYIKERHINHIYQGPKRITLTLLQTVVLLLFNDKTRHYLSFTDILSSTSLGNPYIRTERRWSLYKHKRTLDELELRRVLTSLLWNEYPLLRKEPIDQEIKPTDLFYFNDNFTCSSDSLKMITATLNEVIEKDAELDKTVLLSREQQIDAVIVRIMKSKKQLGHGLLLSEVTRQVRFPVTVSLNRIIVTVTDLCCIVTRYQEAYRSAHRQVSHNLLRWYLIFYSLGNTWNVIQLITAILTWHSLFIH